jgi:hypothetical protein
LGLKHLIIALLIIVNGINEILHPHRGASGGSE